MKLSVLYLVSGAARPLHVCFCRPVGEDPLSDSECDLDSVAGVLKLYFRGLEPPLFPYDSYLRLLECVRKTPLYHLHDAHALLSLGGPTPPFHSGTDTSLVGGFPLQICAVDATWCRFHRLVTLGCSDRLRVAGGVCSFFCLIQRL